MRSRVEVAVILAVLLFLLATGCARPEPGPPVWAQIGQVVLDGEAAAAQVLWLAVEVQNAAKPGSIPPDAYKEALQLQLDIALLYGTGCEAVAKQDRTGYLAAQAALVQKLARLMQIKDAYCSLQERGQPV